VKISISPDLSVLINHNNDPLDPSPLPFSHIKQQFSDLKLPANKHPVVSFHPTHPTISTSSFSLPHALSLNAPLASSFQAFFIVSSSSSPLRRPATPLPRRNPTSRTTTATTTTRDNDNDAFLPERRQCAAAAVTTNAAALMPLLPRLLPRSHNHILASVTMVAQHTASRHRHPVLTIALPQLLRPPHLLHLMPAAAPVPPILPPNLHYFLSHPT